MSDFEVRFSKIDDAIQRLASVASDLSRMLAVHEQRLNQQEKTTESAVELLEERRKEFDKKIDEVYDTFRLEDKTIAEEIKLSRLASSKQHEEQNTKISKIEKFIWMACGGGAAIGYIISIAINYAKSAPPH